MAAALALGAAGSAAGGPKVETLVDFVQAARRPTKALVQGPDGNFYGTTAAGGAADAGTVFRISPRGQMTTVLEFANRGAGILGGKPNAPLVLGADGNFYGSTTAGGASNNGTLFRLTPAGQLTTLVEFSGNGASNRGAQPSAALRLGSDGNFYGTTATGGAGGVGTVFRVTPTGTLTTLAEFTDNATTKLGRYPMELAEGSDGNFYGMTSMGGASGYGTAFRMTSAGVLTKLVDFNRYGNGAYPQGGLVRGADGNFYGTTSDGGGGDLGTVFRLTPGGTLTTIRTFSYDGAGTRPNAGLILGADGNFYGTTYTGGSSLWGTVFRITPDGALTTLAEFGQNISYERGYYPRAALVQGTDGNFYGTTSEGGAGNNGAVFRVASDGALTTLAQFAVDAVNTSGGRGAYPHAALELGADGNFYGTTYRGGASNNGTVFRVTPAGTMTTLVEFTGSGGANRGTSPEAKLMRGADGNFYGTTHFGGAADMGTVFRVTPEGQLTTLVEFTGHGAQNRGSIPLGGLTRGTDGNLYGTTSYGGASNNGTVFRLAPDGSLTTIVDFTGAGASNRGAGPVADLIQGTDGNFYGTTSRGGGAGQGTVFCMSPAGALITLVEFTGSNGVNRGSNPQAGVVQGSDGMLYGTTTEGGTTGYGTIFRLTTGGAMTTLVDFSYYGGPNPGARPVAALVEGTDGNFYGTTSTGGVTSYNGTIFRVTPTGTLAMLVNFSGNGPSNRGASAVAGLTRGSDGNLYGTTVRGGTSDAGTVYRLRFEPDGSSTQLVSVAVEPRAGTRVRWQATVGQVSRVEYSDDLTGAWQSFAGTVTANGAGTIELLDATSPRPGQRAYRLVTPFWRRCGRWIESTARAVEAGSVVVGAMR